MKFKDLPKDRGDILATFITIENGMSMIIAKHYLGDSPSTETFVNKELDFLFNVMGNDQFTFGLRRNIFAHILRVDNVDNSLLDELGRLNTLRNIFAHRPPLTIENPQTPESEVYYSNPKFPWDRTKNIVAEDLKKEFYSLSPDIVNWLYTLAQKKGYVFPPIKPLIDKQESPAFPEGAVQS